VESIREIAASLVRDFSTARMLAWRLFLRDTRAQFRASFLGYVWLFLPPIATTLVWIFLDNQQVISVDTGSVPYPFFVLMGNLLWTAFATSLTGSLGIVGEAGGVLSKLNFPHEALVMTSMLKVLLNTAVQALLIVPAAFLFSASLSWATFLVFPLGLLSLVLLGYAIGVILVPAATLFADIGRSMQFVTRFWFFLTPVVYPVPETGLGRFLAQWNPVSPLIVTTRGLTAGGETPLFVASAIIFAAALLLLLAGVFLFKLAMPRLIERMSA